VTARDSSRVIDDLPVLDQPVLAHPEDVRGRRLNRRVRRPDAGRNL
jgi:hypothetical protein